MSVLVKNLSGTTGKTLPKGYTSWLDFWEKKKGKNSFYCRKILCNQIAEVGGHVIIKNTTNKEYIVPICKSCNNTYDHEFYVAESDLVEIHE